MGIHFIYQSTMQPNYGAPGGYPPQQNMYGAPPGGYPGGPPQYGPDGQPMGPDGDRGLGKALLIGAGAAVAAIGTYAVYSKVTSKKKKKVKTKNGKTREIDCDVLVDSTGRELPGQEFDEYGRCVNENEVLSRAANSGQIPPANNGPQQPVAPYGSNIPMNQGPGGYGQPHMGGPPPMGSPYGGPPPMGSPYGAPPPQMGGYPQMGIGGGHPPYSHTNYFIFTFFIFVIYCSIN